MSYQVLARKWRPRDFSTLVGQEHVVKALTHALEQNRLHHAWLFTGTRGVGKTTLSRILAKALNCTGADGSGGITAQPCGVCRACTEIDAGRFVDYIEMDAASNRGVDEMAQLLDKAVYGPGTGRFKVYMIDEVHMLTNHAFNAMLKTLEEPPEHVKFILATTDPQKIPVTVLSRCLQFNLKQMPPGHIVGHLENILAQEGIGFEPNALRLLAKAASGSMRDALSLTDQAIAYSAGQVGEEAVRGMLGALDQSYLVRLLDALAADAGATLLEIADEMAQRSLSFSAALQDLASLLHKIALAQAVPQAVSDDWPEAADVRRLAGAFDARETQLFYQIANQGRAELALAPDEYAGFTMALLRMLAFRPANLPPEGGAGASGGSAGGAAAGGARGGAAAAGNGGGRSGLADASARGAQGAGVNGAVGASAAALNPAVASGLAPHADAGDPAAPAARAHEAVPAAIASRPAEPGAQAPARSEPGFEAQPVSAPAKDAPARALSPAMAALAAMRGGRGGEGPAASRAAPAGSSRPAGPQSGPASAIASKPTPGAVAERAPVNAATSVPVARPSSRPTGDDARAPMPRAAAGAPARAPAQAPRMSLDQANLAAAACAGDDDADIAFLDLPPWEEALPAATTAPDAQGEVSNAASRAASAAMAIAARNSRPKEAADAVVASPAATLAADASARAESRPEVAQLAGIVDGFDGDWPALAARLPLRGLAQQLAFQTELVGIEPQGEGAAPLRVILRAPMRQMADGGATERLEQCLSETFGRAVTLAFEFGSVQATAAVADAEARAERQREAEATVNADPFVQSLLREFGGSIVPGSVRPV